MSHSEMYTLSLHDALPISGVGIGEASIGWEVGNWITKITEGTYKWLLVIGWIVGALFILYMAVCILDRKSTRLNSSHVAISYAVFCLKKKNKIIRYKVMTR